MVHLDDGRRSGTADTFSKAVGRLLNTFSTTSARCCSRSGLRLFSSHYLTTNSASEIAAVLGMPQIKKYSRRVFT